MMPANMAIAFNGRGNGHAGKGQPDRALEDYDQAIRLNPSYAEPHYNRGNVYLATGQYDRAIEDYDQAVRLNPNYAARLQQPRHRLAPQGPVRPRHPGLRSGSSA